MKPLSFTLLFMALVSTTSAFAEGGSDRLKANSDRLAEQRQINAEMTAQTQQAKPAPVAEKRTSNDVQSKVSG